MKQKSFLIEALLNDEYICTPQEAKHSTYFALDAIDYANFKLSVKCTAYQIQSKIRAFAFRPYQLLKLELFFLFMLKIDI